MSKRWLSGVLIFALSLGSSSLVTNAMAQEPREERGVLEEGLGYVMNENEVRLVNTGGHVYLVMIQRAPGTTRTEGSILYLDGTGRFSKYALSQAVLFRLEPIAVLAEDFWRPCAMGDCSFIGPLPPPPPPIAPPDPTAMFLSPQ